MKNLIKTSALALATTFASTGIYADEAVSVVDQGYKSNTERTINRAAGYLILGKELSPLVDGSGFGADVRATADSFEATKGAFGEFQDNIYFMGGMRYLSGDGSRTISTINQKHEVTYLSVVGGAGYLHNIRQVSDSSSLDLKVFVGLGIGYSSYNLDYTVTELGKFSQDETGFHIHYNSGVILGLKNIPEIQLEAGYQSMHKGSVADEYYVRADYDLNKKLDMPVSASARFDAADGSFSLGAVYHF